MDYIANPVRVKALQIVDSKIVEEDFCRTKYAVLKLDDGSSYKADEGMIARYIPYAGDYLVTQEDGYTYINPREVFERKYSPAGAKVSFSENREISQFLRDVGDKCVQRGEKADMAVVIYGSFGGNFYVDSAQSSVEALGVMEIGKATMMGAILKKTFIPEEV